jgi:raffinose/stachyose/melibiose transport system substrate-binding protein
MRPAGKKLLLLTLLTAMACGFAACGSKDDAGGAASPSGSAASGATADGGNKPFTLTMGISTSNANKPGLKEMVQLYHEQTGNTIEIQAIDDKQWDNVLNARVASGGELWDIIWDKYRWENQIKFKAAELTNEPWVSRINDSVLATLKGYSPEGKLWAVPYAGSQTIGIVYNKKVFSDLGISIPKTIAEFEAAADKIKAAGITPIYIAAKDGFPVVQVLSSFIPNMEKTNPTMIDDLNANKKKWSEIPEFMDWLKLMQSWREKGYFNKDVATGTYENSQKLLAEGKVAMLFQGEWIVADLKNKYPDLDYGLMAPPSKDGDNYIDQDNPDAMYAVDGPNAEHAKEFFRWWTSKETLDKYGQLNPLLPVFKDQEIDNLNPMAKDAQVYAKAGKTKGHWNNRYLVTYTNDMNNVLAGIFLGTPAEKVAQMWDDFCISQGKQQKLPNF